tara:strand:+ start:906 stop:1520 length:615 start_codon:yes stop_codon:yes gene_type:complete
MKYTINEIFYSVQGEGMRAGEASVFVRFSGCNLRCSMEPSDKSPGGFNCDTEFVSGRKVTLDELIDWIKMTHIGSPPSWVVLSGGEPLLQLNEKLINRLKKEGYKLAIETNGTKAIPDGLDWVVCSPKVAEHALIPTEVDELKYVRHYGQGIPKPKIKAKVKIISPAFDAREVPRETLKWCIQLVKDNPEWRLSVQQHNQWKVR